MSRKSDGFDPDAWLDSLEPIGWRLGLERIEALCDELGRPQDRFATIHVVGTNGKSSVARMIAAVLEAHGISAGCIVSPHLSSWSERVLIAGREPAPAEFEASIRKTAAAAETVNGRLEPGDSLTQFEISTAAGFLSLAEGGVEVAAIEAGLGGRLDATNTINSSVTVLTSIGLDHTEWLGETEDEIAAEKLAVLRPGTVLVLGAVAADVRDLAVETAAGLGCDVIEPGDDLPAGVEPGSPAIYQRGNFALAIAAAEQFLRVTGRPGVIGREALVVAAAAAAVPGRLERVAGDPPVFFDVAHNRPAAAALAESVPVVAGGSPVVGLIAILDDKDARGILTELAPALELVIFTEIPPGHLAGSARPGARCHEPEALLAIADAIGLRAEVCRVPEEAMDRARRLAAESGGIVLASGSHYLLQAAGKYRSASFRQAGSHSEARRPDSA